jgi:p-hydroxybenzoate 3-monooxygenase
VHTNVAIIGAGPAGLSLARRLRAQGIDSVILEARDRAYVEQRVRAGVLEPGTEDLMAEIGVDERLRREGLVQDGFDLRFEERSHHIPVKELIGRPMTIYPQAELVRDLIKARLDDGDPLHFEVADVQLHDVTTEHPYVTYTHGGEPQRLDCDAIAGCDGFHGVSRPTIPADVLRTYEHVYPFAWLGILARVAPSSDELIYTRHERGYALYTLRSPEFSRLYIQCRPDEDLDEWPDERVWEELRIRLATDDDRFELLEGPVVEKSITKLRSFVAEPMQYGRLFLAGDAAHIVPPSGAKGLNLAVADVRELAPALTALLRDGDESLAAAYSQTCLDRVWRVQTFSFRMTSLLHRFPDHDEFQRRLQIAQLEQIAGSRHQARAFAESYTGLRPEQAFVGV